MTIREFISEMDKLYPKTLSAEWDTDGLQCCADPDRELRRVLVALDATAAELDAAIDGGYDLLLTHHPMIFGKAGDIVPWRLNGNRIIRLVTAGVAAASFHTRLDAGEGGVNDCLTDALGFSDTVAFGDAEMPTAGRIGTLKSSMTAAEFAALVKNKLNAPTVRLSGNRTVSRVAMVGGAGKDFVIPAIAAGADAIVTGEVSYNSAIDFAESGIIVIEAGHFHTEFPVCKRLCSLVTELAGAEADIYTPNTQIIL